MKSILQGASGLILFVVAILGIWIGLANVFGYTQQLLLPIWATVFLAFVTPVTIIAIRHQVRLTRVKLIELFAHNFGFDPVYRAASPLGGSVPPPLGGADISFEFVKGKYYADLDLLPGTEPTSSDMPRFPMMLHADWMLLICALPYMIFAGFGIFLLFAPVIEIMAPRSSISTWLFPSMLALGGTDSQTITSPEWSAAMHVNVLTVAALAFAGSYFFTLRLLLRAVAVFDLSPITFLRCFAHMVMAVTLAVVIYRVVPSPETFMATLKQLAGSLGLVEPPREVAAPDPKAGVAFLWLFLAFALGFLPDTALQYVLQRSGLTFKQRYGKVEQQAKTVPVTIIDGIDPTMSFRLEEANIYDVQNLATFNPIMLHIESPYGIYQTIDWVAQAQLCLAVGPERFLALRMLNIRTVFDLEEAMLADPAVPWLQEQVGRLLVGDSLRDREMRDSFFGASEPEGGVAPAGAMPAEAAIRIARLIANDLHVRRLRHTWERIADRLAEEASAETATRPGGADGQTAEAALRPSRPANADMPAAVAAVGAE